MNDFGIRIVSAVALATHVLTATAIGGVVFQVSVYLYALACAVEMNALRVWSVTATLVSAAAMDTWACMMIDLRQVQPHALYWLFCSVWAADTGAYMVGRLVGGPRLAPCISPQKTVAGFCGALVFGTIAGFLAAHGPTCLVQAPLQMCASFVGPTIAASLLVSVASQVGDLLESALKRSANVKDSGAWIPGHGGFLDRMDGLIAATPLVWAIIQSTR